MLPELLVQIQGWLFTGLLILVLGLEWLTPLRRRPDQIRRRWAANIGLYILVACTLFLLLPAGLLHFTRDQPSHGLNALGLSPWLSIALTILLLDFWRYWEHRWLHEVPLLWRCHLVHHSDAHIDVTTTERHHPLEAVLSMFLVIAVVVVLGLPAEGLVVYYSLALVVALFSHANINLPAALDNALGKLIVTPAIHALHHSDQQPETDSNYGALLTVWDRLFGTFTKPDPQREIRFGLGYFSQPSDQGLGSALLQPLLYRKGMTALARDTSVAPASKYDAQSATPAGPISQQARMTLYCAVAGLVIATAALLPIALDMIHIWGSHGEWQYAFLVLPVFIYLIGWEFRAELLNERFNPGFSGLLLAIPACLLIWFCQLMDINLGQQVGLILVYQGIIMSTLGWRVYWKYLSVWGLLFLLVPYADVAMPALRAATFGSVQLFSAATGLPFSADGYAFEIGDHAYAIVAACSGMNYFTLAIFLGYSLGVVVYRRLAPTLLLTLVCGIVAMIANFARVNAIIYMDWISGTQADLAGHSPYRWIAYGLMFALLALILTRLHPRMPVALRPDTAQRIRSERWLGPAVTVSLCLSVASLPATGTADNQVPLPNSSRFAPPHALGDYQKVGDPGPWQARPGRDITYTELLYSNGERTILTIAERATSRSAKLSPGGIMPDREHDWIRSRSDLREGCTDSRCINYRHTTWTLRGTDELFNVYATYVIDEDLSASELALRMDRGFSKWRGTEDRTAVIALASDDPIKSPADIAGFLHGIKSGLHIQIRGAHAQAVTRSLDTQ